MEHTVMAVLHRTSWYQRYAWKLRSYDQTEKTGFPGVSKNINNTICAFGPLTYMPRHENFRKRKPKMILICW